MRQNLIYQERENPDGVVFNPEILENEQNWAYLRETQTMPDYEEHEEEDERIQALIYGQTSGKGLRSHLIQKEKQIKANASVNSLAPSGVAANEASAESENFDRLRGILDSDDPRFERLHQ